MPQLENHRWELFCRAMSRGAVQADAYEEAGFERSSANASTLKRRPEVMARIDELIKERLEREGKETHAGTERMDAAKAEISATGTIRKEWILEELVENIKMAREAGQFSASNKGLEMLGKEMGLFQDKSPSHGDTEAQKKLSAEQARNAIPIGQVNKLLEAIGFKGTVDLSTMQPVKAPIVKGKPGRPKKTDAVV